MPYIPLINPDTGEIDTLAIAERAPLRAAHEYGGSNFPPSYLRDATRWLNDRAEAERVNWRQRHGLRDDSPCSVMTVPAWGNAGDSFGRAR